MIKMIKHFDDKVYYWEVWQNGKYVVVHFGMVGDKGETEKKKLSLFQNAEKLMNELAKEKKIEGYSYLDEDKLIELVVQYSYEESEMEKALNLRHSVEDLMNECLGWTGNGSCDGGDIGSGTANIFNYVLDVKRATKTIIEELTNNNLLEGVKIAYLNPKDEDYLTLYPEGAKFHQM